ncbi:MAG TPA: nuclear transport factor 2 family protein [Terriglobales bacterium]|jgi:hypothetical protein|nr:nuclear transport factor 2 family protein [Terriglobales bacterium]
MRRALVTLAVLLVSCLLVFAQADKSKGADKSALLNIEKQLWKAWEQGDTKPFEQHLASNAMSIGASGIMDRSASIRDIGKKECEVKSWSIDEATVRTEMIAKDTTLLIYKGMQDATCSGQKAPPTVWASSIYKKEGGQWKTFWHQETPAMEGMAAGETKKP